MPQADRTVRQLLFREDFRRLLATRLLSQAGDGVFQAAVAGTVLFNPQRAAGPVDVAAGFAVLLLPYSVVGPFAGVRLDRWSRRQVLVRANVLRAGLVAAVAVLVGASVDGPAFYAAGLAVISVNRFVLAALSAGLPHTTDRPSLVSANALSTTSGAVVTVLGGLAGLAVVQVTGAGNGTYAGLALASAVPYLAAATVVSGFPRPCLGPDHELAAHPARARDVLAGMAAGARHARARPPAASALAVIALHRLCFGALTLMTLLLYRNTFHSGDALFPGGLTGLGEAVAAGAAGTLAAAVVTPPVVRRIGKPRWVTLLLTAGGAGQLALGSLFTAPAVVAVALLLGFVAQAVKICVDTTVQECIDDDFRGRVFSLYDTLFNVAFVVGLLVAAGALQSSGRSYPMLLAVGAAYLLTAAAWRGGVARARKVPSSDPAHKPSAA